MTSPGRLPGPVAERWGWQLAAACRGADPALFFPADSERGPHRAAREAAAKAVCRCCPVRPPCAAHALAAGESSGVWGGLVESDRERQQRADRRVVQDEPL